MVYGRGKVKARNNSGVETFPVLSDALAQRRTFEAARERVVQPAERRRLCGANHRSRTLGSIQRDTGDAPFQARESRCVHMAQAAWWMAQCIRQRRCPGCARSQEAAHPASHHENSCECR